MSLPSERTNFNSSDEALLEMLRSDSNHESALKSIFERYNVRMFNLAFGVLRDEELAKDLVQDIFIDLWNRRHTSNIRGLSHYLLRAIKFQVLKQLRNGKLRGRHLQILQRIEFVNQTEESLDVGELEKLLHENLNLLPPRCREVFFLSRFDDLSNKEISDRLKISVKTVEGQITKALAFLRTSFDKTIFFLVIFPIL